MEELKGYKNALFITTKNKDYLRNVQEIKLLQQYCDNVDVLGYSDRSYFARLIKLYLNLIFKRMKRYDLIFVGFAPQLIVPWFNWKFKRSKLVIDFFISMYDTFVFDRKKFKVGGSVAMLLKRVDIITIKKADLVISDTQAHGKYFVDEFGLDDRRLRTLYLDADKSIYYPRQQVKPERMKDKFVVLYFGSVLPLQGLDIILDAIEKLKNNKDMCFIVVGPISDRYVKPISSNVEYYEWLSQKELATYISYSDLCIAGHFNNDINKAKRTIPGKAYIYREMGKPMILGDNLATRELYDESMDGIHFVKMGDSEALAVKIQELSTTYGL